MRAAIQKHGSKAAGEAEHRDAATIYGTHVTLCLLPCGHINPRTPVGLAPPPPPPPPPLPPRRASRLPHGRCAKQNAEHGYILSPCPYDTTVPVQEHDEGFAVLDHVSARHIGALVFQRESFQRHEVLRPAPPTAAPGFRHAVHPPARRPAPFSQPTGQATVLTASFHPRNHTPPPPVSR